MRICHFDMVWSIMLVIMVVSIENSMLSWLLFKWHVVLCLVGIFTMSNLFSLFLPTRIVADI
jgi:hypothetical protein